MSTEGTTDERLKSVVEALEDTFARTEATSQVLTSLGSMFESAASVVAWQVAVASPGFLGLLWNARELADQSRLPSPVFALLFGVSELSFLLAIISSVFLHGFLTSHALNGSIGVMTRGVAGTLVRRLKAIGDMERSGSEVREVFEQLNLLFKEHDKIVESVGRLPWYFNAAGRLHACATVLGYILLGVIIATLDLT